ncbi:MAG: WecB/TagA/CpsF family glycosyltransferase [Treponema sp.]|nr:WecB/TagA/CpsF family glycosyltransferase [Treponema sp.]MBQ6567405.1 WecB/TagA/CpsF family glycosyltransferase [Treponema sp.]
MEIERIKLLGVPVDVCRPADFESAIVSLMEREGPKQIVFLSIWDLLKARGKGDFARAVKQADLVLPISRSIISGARFLRLTVPTRWNPFETMVNIMTLLENRYKSVYLLGGHKKTLLAAERNVRMTFRSLQIVGRYVGYYPKSEDAAVTEAVRKSSPSLVIMSDGLKDKFCWFHNRRESFSTSMFLYYPDAIAIFSERKAHVRKETFDKGLEIFPELLRSPLKCFLIFPFISYKLMLVWHRLTD